MCLYLRSSEPFPQVCSVDLGFYTLLVTWVWGRALSRMRHTCSHFGVGRSGQVLSPCVTSLYLSTEEISPERPQDCSARLLSYLYPGSAFPDELTSLGYEVLFYLKKAV